MCCQLGGLPGKMDISDDSGAVWAAGTSDRLLGKPRPRLGSLYELPHPECDPFRAMMAHPPVVQRLSWMLGHGYHETQEPIANLWPPGTGGFSLHADEGDKGYTFATSGNGRTLCDQVNVQVGLRELAEATMS